MKTLELVNLEKRIKNLLDSTAFRRAHALDTLAHSSNVLAMTVTFFLVAIHEMSSMNR
jgi:hypothetical protein